MSRALSLVATATLAGLLASCGGGGENGLPNETSVRDCLADSGLGAKPRGEQPLGPPPYLSTAPDFSAYSREGTRVDVVVQGTEAKAVRTAADVRSAMLPLGIPDADQRVVASQNVVAVFADSPSTQERGSVRSCLESAG